MFSPPDIRVVGEGGGRSWRRGHVPRALCQKCGMAIGRRYEVGSPPPPLKSQHALTAPPHHRLMGTPQDASCLVQMLVSVQVPPPPNPTSCIRSGGGGGGSWHDPVGQDHGGPWALPAGGKAPEHPRLHEPQDRAAPDSGHVESGAALRHRGAPGAARILARDQYVRLVRDVHRGPRALVHKYVLEKFGV